MSQASSDYDNAFDIHWCQAKDDPNDLFGRGSAEGQSLSLSSPQAAECSDVPTTPQPSGCQVVPWSPPYVHGEEPHIG